MKESKGIRIYLDACCLARPFDDLTQDRINIEADAVLTVLSHCEIGEWILCSSTVLDMEIGRISDEDKLKKTKGLLAVSRNKLRLTDTAKGRAIEFQRYGVKVMDSLHLAVAETGSVDVFLTTDDGFLRTATRSDTTMTVANPVVWLMEVIQNE